MESGAFGARRACSAGWEHRGPRLRLLSGRPPTETGDLRGASEEVKTEAGNAGSPGTDTVRFLSNYQSGASVCQPGTKRAATVGPRLRRCRVPILDSAVLSLGILEATDYLPLPNPGSEQRG